MTYPTDLKEYRIVRVEKVIPKEEPFTETIFFVEYLEKSWFGKTRWTRFYSGQKSFDNAKLLMDTMIEFTQRINGEISKEEVVWEGRQ